MVHLKINAKDTNTLIYICQEQIKAKMRCLMLNVYIPTNVFYNPHPSVRMGSQMLVGPFSCHQEAYILQSFN